MSEYSAEEFEAEECGKYRDQFPTETKGLTDEALFDLTHETVDDMDAAGWQILFQTRGKINLSVIREAFTEAKERDLQLSDELLVGIIKRAGKTWSDFQENDDNEGAIAFLEKAEETAKQVMTSDPGISVLVKKMDKKFHEAVAQDIEHIVKGKTTAVHMYSHFRRIYTREEMNSFPIIGSEGEWKAGGNAKRPDKWKTKDQVGKPITVVWSNDLVSAMPEGKEYEGDLDDIAKETKAPGSVPRLRGKSKQALAALKSDATTRRNGLRSMVKRAISLHQQWEAISEMPKVGIEWIAGTKEKFSAIIPEEFGTGVVGDVPTIVTVAPRSLWIYPKGQAGQGRDFSVTQLLSFDVSLALAEGGTAADLIATAGRGADDDDGDGTGDGSDLAEDAAQEVASQFYNWAQQREHTARVLKAIANRKADASGNDWLDLVGSIYLWAKPIYEKNKAAYEELQTKPEPEAEPKTGTN